MPTWAHPTSVDPHNVSCRLAMARVKANGHAQNPLQPLKGYNGVAKEVGGAEVEATDLTRWRLLDERGRQTWHYLERDEEVARWPQSTADKYFLDLPLVRQTPQSSCEGLPVFTTLTRARYRISLHFHHPKHLSPPYGVLSRSSLTYSYHRGTGLANMAGLCSSSQAWSLPGM